MRIRLGILDDNTRYTSLLATYFNRHYSEQLEIHIYNSLDSFEQNSHQKRIDVLLANPDILQGTSSIPSNVGVAYLSESTDIESIRDVRAVCKYQKAELIYKEIISIYSEIETGEVYRMGGLNSRVLLFRGVSGGVGATTTAVSCAASIAGTGRTVLYLNLEENGVVSHLLRGEGSATLSDVLYVVKSRHSNIALKLDSMVRKDFSGVCFFAPFSVMLDSCNLHKEDVKSLMDAIRISGNYDYIVIDVSPHTNDFLDYLNSLAEYIFLVSDGSEVSGIKLQKLIEAMAIEDERDDSTVLRRTSLIYNRFGSWAREVVCNPQVDVFARINRYEGASALTIRDQIAGSGLFDSFN